uniref:Uncharacterized protein n=1 Tax=Anguilla anguilla TaxID=7936 RepID=A0A0E9W0S1_ANGAN
MIEMCYGSMKQRFYRLALPSFISSSMTPFFIFSNIAPNF